MRRAAVAAPDPDDYEEPIDEPTRALAARVLYAANDPERLIDELLEDPAAFRAARDRLAVYEVRQRCNQHGCLGSVQGFCADPDHPRDIWYMESICEHLGLAAVFESVGDDERNRFAEQYARLIPRHGGHAPRPRRGWNSNGWKEGWEDGSGPG